MSTDTMYLDRSRVLTAPGKNRTNNHVARLDKKRIEADKRHKSKQQTGPSIPKTQVLPNGEKPDFGSSGSSRRSKKRGKEQSDAKEVAKSLRSLYLQDEDGKKSQIQQQGGSKTQKNKARSDSSSSSGSNSTPKTLTPPTGFASPLDKSMMPSGHPEILAVRPLSPLGAHTATHPIPQAGFQALPQKLPVPSPMGAPLQAPVNGFQRLPLQPHCFGGPGFPYGNYAVGTSQPVPYFMNPQAPLMNPMYPQMPLPVMQVQVPQAAQPHGQSQSKTAVQIEKPSSTSRPSSSKKTQKSTSFAGASFASKDPMINNLPKPSFT